MLIYMILIIQLGVNMLCFALLVVVVVMFDGWMNVVLEVLLTNIQLGEMDSHGPISVRTPTNLV
ncbi:hypothetical protein GLOIN_2v1872704 [Rhizophagus irregularis DAOM 181602=DAOM 197198]|uniref:Transmembrane protein n=1 Tax=Rhizophagus irregularis (strain DAOM 181602 / DAOM 197198 / MUCL 43194) TaxID=747089 RepID=A0A2P4QD31_RHIID|nr:hypothetical protein GLOIN_2v1872704 [Rhizophagus irregularis DAOM 181602=DAOM 197198]POG75546.1 hypothetical protein GLOIN_2v1872704 [Rhizophagus irregularis DAOM 181602=DAOM 197198]|eukprot:XP_025182412.1 hypothetical protein GLOIN_2v1872704 [Rhizophagus irregularis DAOM 181602=DAOM 197198]